MVVWVMMLYDVAGYQHFGGHCYIHLHCYENLKSHYKFKGKGRVMIMEVRNFTLLP
jgi:hypothetical protein